MARTESGAIVWPTREGASVNSRTHAPGRPAAARESAAANNQTFSIVTFSMITA